MSNVKKKRIKGSKILLVEDEETLAHGLEYNLLEEGYQVVWAADGKQALDYFSAQEFDLIILDVMLPYYDGFEIARKIREQSSQLPILILTAKKGTNDKIKGLQIGVDDYMTKPFHLKELLLRVGGMLKRKEWYTAPTAHPIYKFGEVEVKFDTLSYQKGEREFPLTLREAMVLKYLIDHKGEIVSRKELLENVWNLQSEIETRTVDNFIVRLRKYFEKNPAKPVFIKSVRGAGYIFND